MAFPARFLGAVFDHASGVPVGDTGVFAVWGSAFAVEYVAGADGGEVARTEGWFGSSGER